MKKNITEKFPYIVIEGPIGSGKTTLARKLADRFPVNLLLEKADDSIYGDEDIGENRRWYCLSSFSCLSKK